MRFSQRFGLTPPTKIVQKIDIDQDLRNSLWSLLTVFYWETYRSPGSPMYGRSDNIRGSNLYDLIFSLWLNFFKQPVDTIDRYWGNCLENLRTYFHSAQWFEVYDFIEFVACNGSEEQKVGFIAACNSYLERENSAYRFVDGRITEITSDQEIQEIEQAVENATPYAGVKAHLNAALGHLSSKTNPDFRNSIKESISAVESLAKQLTQDASPTLGHALKSLEKDKGLHPALKSAFSSLYGYSSDAEGIRHALLTKPNLTKADARFMLICCSAFINYMIDTISS